MTDKTFTAQLKKKDSLSEEDLALEMAEDLRLRAIGIDPSGDPVDIMVELDRRAAHHRNSQEENENLKPAIY